MTDLAMTAVDDAITDIAAYFASLNTMRGTGSTTDPNAKNLFLNGDQSRQIAACASCHGPNGKGSDPNPANIPVIGEQHSTYLQHQQS